jgi:hypothetical protein
MRPIIWGDGFLEPGSIHLGAPPRGQTRNPYTRPLVMDIGFAAEEP